MTDEELELKKLIKDCGRPSCPLYNAFWNEPNSQSHFRKDQSKWSQNFRPKPFKIGEEIFGAKLALVMESPPPAFMEYFYGPEGSFRKEKGLFKNLIRQLIEIEGMPKDATEEKEYWLKWFASLGIVIVDAVKCRMKITPGKYDSNEPKTEKITSSQIGKSIVSCSDILTKQLRIINPFRVAVGIASVFDHQVLDSCYIKSILKELENEDAFIDKRTVSLWDYGGPETFLKWFEEIWLQVKNELRNYDVQSI